MVMVCLFVCLFLVGRDDPTPGRVENVLVPGM